MYFHPFFLILASSRFSTHLPKLRFLSPMQPTTSSSLLINFSSPQHPTYTSIALHVPDVIPLPGHHERVHRHLPAQPRLETSRSVRTASRGQCFRNPLHDLPTPVDFIWYSILSAPQFSLPNLQFLLHIVTHLVHVVLQCQVHLDTVLRFHMALMHPHNHNTSLEFPPCSLFAPEEMRDCVSSASRLVHHTI